MMAPDWYRSRFVLLATTVLFASNVYAQDDGREVTFDASDGVTIYGDLYAGEDSRQPLILLFHQAGTNGRAEYASIVPRLRSAGYDLLVLDQRSGGSRGFGGHNRTVAANGGASTSYCDAMPDLEAALAYARKSHPAVRPVVWGSSYSAALVIQLAARYPDDVSGVLAFSPATGDPMDGCRPDAHTADLEVPLLALRPQAEADRSAAQLAALTEQGHQTYVSDPGTHGSSMLVAERAGGNVDATWDVVLTFLETLSTQAD